MVTPLLTHWSYYSLALSHQNGFYDFSFSLTSTSGVEVGVPWLLCLQVTFVADHLGSLRRGLDEHDRHTCAGVDHDLGDHGGLQVELRVTWRTCGDETRTDESRWNNDLTFWWHDYFNGLVQERRNPSALAMELRLSCTSPLIFFPKYFKKRHFTAGPWGQDMECPLWFIV